jgi:ABC-type multidrug transport system fused ATPase/permease subunit
MLDLILRKFSKTILIRSLALFPESDRKKIFLIAFIQIFLGLLDLLGVLMIGVIGALAISGIGSQQLGSGISSILSFLGLDNVSLQTQALYLSLFATALLVSKTIFSAVMTRKILFYLSRQSVGISGKLLARLLFQSLQSFHKKSIQENLFSITSGVSILTVGVIATFINIIADLSLLCIMLVGLMVVDAYIAISTIVFFLSVGYVLYRIMNVRAHEIGIEQTRLGISANQKIYEILGTFREALVRNRREYYAREISKQRLLMANNSAEIAFMPSISKYVIELAVILGLLLICAIQFISQDSVKAVSILSIFLVASLRIAPAVLRLQQNIMTLRTNSGSAASTLDLIDSLKNLPEVPEVNDEVIFNHSNFLPQIELENVSMTYSDSAKPTIDKVSFVIQAGESVAVVGNSGAGKTTLIDLILGIHDPDSGKVKISGIDPREAIARWPGAISYVPQDVMLIKGSIKENVALGFPVDNVSDDQIWECLKIAQMEDFVKELPNQILSHVGDRGVKLSGGQRQRIGIARAMFTNPMLLVLDEATSALDSETEINVARAFHKKRKQITTITIAHRPSTIKFSDRIIHLQEGSILSDGSYDQFKDLNPQFNSYLE